MGKSSNVAGKSHTCFSACIDTELAAQCLAAGKCAVPISAYDGAAASFFHLVGLADVKGKQKVWISVLPLSIRGTALTSQSALTPIDGADSQTNRHTDRVSGSTILVTTVKKIRKLQTG